MAAPQTTQPEPSRLELAAAFLEKVYTRASETKYGKNLSLWINPEETKNKEYVAVRDSVISDVVQKSGLYIPGLDAKRKYYKEQLDIFSLELEKAARSWAVDDLQSQVPKLVNLLLASKSQAERLHVAALEVKKAVNAKNFVLPTMSSDETKEITNESGKQTGRVTTRLQRFSYMYFIRSHRTAKPGGDATYDQLFYLMAHPHGVKIVDEFAKSADEGWQYTSETISGAMNAVVKTVESLNTDKNLIWRLPIAVTAGVAKLGFGKRLAVTRFALAWAATQKGWLESAIETAMDAIFVLDLVGGPIGAEVSGVLNFVLAAVGTAVSFLRDVQQDQAANATAFGDKAEKVSEGSRGIGTLLQSVATLAAATALPGVVSKITGRTVAAGKALEIAEHVPVAREAVDPKLLNRAVQKDAVKVAEEKGIANSVRAAETEQKSVQRGIKREPAQVAALPEKNVKEAAAKAEPVPAETSTAPRGLDDALNLKKFHPDELKEMQMRHPLGERSVPAIKERALEIVTAEKFEHRGIVALASIGRRDKAIEFINLSYVLDTRGLPGARLTTTKFPRNSKAFWREMLTEYPQIFSDRNVKRIRDNIAPVVDDWWLYFHPTQKDYFGDVLIHHHVEQGPWATGIPEKVHREFYPELHPITNPGVIE